MAQLEHTLRARLDALASQNRLRKRRALQHAGAHVITDGQRLLNFCSNDYLGLATEPRAATEAAQGSGASSLVTGYSPELAELEAAIADYLGRDRALVFSSGFAANVGVISALIGRDDLAVCDALNHASLIDGVRLAGCAKAIAPHGDVQAMATAVQAPRNGQAMVISDHVFSMDGDSADLPALAQLAAAGGAWLMLDDAHGFGVEGDGGRGVAAVLDQAQAPILVGTLGKSVGCAGAFVAGSEALIEYLINRARSQVFSTAIPPVQARLASASLSRVRDEHWRRKQLSERIAQFRAGAKQRGLPVTESSTAIQPLVLGSDAAALAASQALEAEGCLVTAIRPPTVPAGTARLRITLSAAHGAADVEQLLDSLARLHDDSAASHAA